MKHYIFHRLEWGEVPYQHDWLVYRLNIYKNYVYRQLAQSKNRNFETVLYVQSDMAEAIELFKPFVNHVVHFNHDLLASDQMLKNDIGEDWIYWTRLDIDDLFSIDVIDEIQKIQPAENMAITMDYGYNFDLKSGNIGIWKFHFQPNSTITIPGSLWQHRQAAKEYAWCRHSEVRNKFQTHIELKKGLYCNLIHNMNKLNTYRGAVEWTPELKKQIAKQYPVLPIA
jgi:hypothetical protein